MFFFNAYQILVMMGIKHFSHYDRRLGIISFNNVKYKLEDAFENQFLFSYLEE